MREFFKPRGFLQDRRMRTLKTDYETDYQTIPSFSREELGVRLRQRTDVSPDFSSEGDGI